MNKKKSITELKAEKQVFFTLVRKTKGILTKRMKLVDGKAVKDSSDCRMSRGKAFTTSLTPQTS